MAVFVFMLAFVALSGAVLSAFSAVGIRDALKRLEVMEQSVSLLWLAQGPNDAPEDGAERKEL